MIEKKEQSKLSTRNRCVQNILIYRSLSKQVRLDLEAAARAATIPLQTEDTLSDNNNIPGKRTSLETAQPHREVEKTPKSKKSTDFFGQVIKLLELTFREMNEHDYRSRVVIGSRAS